MTLRGKPSPWDSGPPQQPRPQSDSLYERGSEWVITGEPVQPGDELDLFNRADDDCPYCGGMGVVVVPDDDPFGIPGEKVMCGCVG